MPRAASVLALAGAMAVTGCSGGSGGGGSASPTGPVPEARVVQALDRTVGAGTSRLAFTISTTAAGMPYVVEGSGAFDYGAHAGRLRFTIPTLHTLRRPVREIVTPATIYLAIPGYTPAGEYYRVDVADRAEAPLVRQFGGTDPSQTLQVLRGVTGVTAGDTSVVRGVRVTRYTGTIDTARALQRLPAGTRSRLAATLQVVAAIPFDAYIDDDGMLRRVVERLHAPAGGGLGQGIDVVSTFDLFDPGAAVHVVPPPRSRTLPGSRLLELLGGGGQ